MLKREKRESGSKRTRIRAKYTYTCGRYT